MRCACAPPARRTQHRAQRHHPRRPRHAVRQECGGEGGVHVDLLVRHHHHDAQRHQHVQQGGDAQGAHDAHRDVGGGVLGLLGRVGHCARRGEVGWMMGLESGKHPKAVTNTRPAHADAASKQARPGTRQVPAASQVPGVCRKALTVVKPCSAGRGTSSRRGNTGVVTQPSWRVGDPTAQAGHPGPNHCPGSPMKAKNTTAAPDSTPVAP